MTTCFGFHF